MFKSIPDCVDQFIAYFILPLSVSFASPIRKNPC